MEKRNASRMRATLKIQSEIRRVLGMELRKRDFIEIPPVILSPITDPLNHPTAPAKINCYGKDYSITQSMIFHKQLALKTLDKIFIFSPNVRLETPDKSNSGRHLFEFTQLDLEVKNAKRKDVMELFEELLIMAIQHVKKNCKKDLDTLSRTLKTPKKPFKKITYSEAVKKYGTDFETMISKENKEPVWIVDIPIKVREFYDREDPKRKGILLDMDLIYPEGYGEALSGGEREHEYEKIKARIRKKGQKLLQFREYLELAKSDLPPSAGFGIGIERLTRFICGLKKIEETSLFPKVPGKNCI